MVEVVVVSIISNLWIDQGGSMHVHKVKDFETNDVKT